MIVYITKEEHKRFCDVFEVGYQPLSFEPFKIKSISRSAFKGLHHTDEAKQDLREHNLGRNNPMYGRKGEKNHFYGKKKEVLTCPHCNKSGGNNVMGRWHFDNCRLNILT